jgi:hypothetical protein
MCAKWLLWETILDRLAQDLDDMALALGQLIPKQDAMMRQRDLPRHGQLAADHAPAEMVWCGARNEWVVTNAVWSPVRPATRWMRVVSSASARLITGRMVARRRASND